MQNPVPSPFFEKGVFGHNPFVYQDNVYRFNPTVTTVGDMLELLTEEEKKILKKKSPQVFKFHPDKPVIIGIIDRVFDDPLLGGVESPAEEDEEIVEEMNDFLTSLNGIEFHKMHYQFQTRGMFEKTVELAFGEKRNPDELSILQFLYLFCINFFVKYLLLEAENETSWLPRVEFFKKVYEDLNAFKYAFLAHDLPKDRNFTHFIVWEE